MLNIETWMGSVNIEHPHEGIERRVLAYNEGIMLVHYTVRRDAVFPIHEHDTIQQAVYVINGEIELRGDTESRLSTGDSFVVGPGIKHGIRGVAPCSEIIDAFSPPIEEYKS